MKHKFLLTASALAAAAAMAPAHAQETGANLEKVVVTGKRANRISKGATGLPMDVKETPQTITSIDREDLTNFGLTGSNEALSLATGINVEQYETNRATFNARGFEIQLTQIDGLGMTNAWGNVVGQEDTFLFERIELIRGANGMLTGVGNSSGTINYIRKRPKNQDGGEVNVTFGSYAQKRVALDYNKVLTQDGTWAGRLVVAHEDKDSHLRDLNDKRSSLYGVVDGQIGDNGVLAVGVTAVDAKQKAPMWGSLTLMRSDGTQADFDDSASTAANWARWNTKSYNGFVEYVHRLSDDWEAKATYNYRHGHEAAKLLYASSPTGVLNPDDTGLKSWAYRSLTKTDNTVLDGNLTGHFSAFGRRHSLLVGVSQSHQKTAADYFPLPESAQNVVLPAFPYNGDALAEPNWGPRTPTTRGDQKLTRFYAASQLVLTDSLKGVIGVNAIRLERHGASIYGNAATNTVYPDTKKTSPYFGLTYDFTPDVLGYVSYSDIFQNQDQTDKKGEYLAPMKGVNTEVGVKAEWLNKALLTTAALFTAMQNLATYGGQITDVPTTDPLYNQYWYEGKDVKSKGFEVEATGRLSRDTKVTLGYTRLLLTGADGNDTYLWIPRNTANFRIDSRLPMLPALRLGLGGRWQSEISNGAKQGAYAVANAFASYELSPAATLRLNVNNLFDKKYITGLAYGAIYSSPRNVALTLDYKL